MEISIFKKWRPSWNIKEHKSPQWETLLNISYLPQPPPFSLVPTFKNETARKMFRKAECSLQRAGGFSLSLETRRSGREKMYNILYEKKQL
jgi:hypothetical protein